MTAAAAPFAVRREPARPWELTTATVAVAGRRRRQRSRAGRAGLAPLPAPADVEPAAAAVIPVHRVVCDGCGWVGYRQRPWCRACPACGVDRSKLRPEWLAGCAPRAGLCCYLAHIWPPPDDPAHPWPGYRHACHYLGSTIDLRVRWPEHMAGGYDPETHKNRGPGSRLIAAALYAGCQVELVRVWSGSQARRLEQRLKQRRKPDSGSLRAGAARSLRPLCPLCSPAGWWRRYPDLPDPPPPPRPRRLVHDPELWDADAEWDAAFPHLAYGPSPGDSAGITGGAR